MLKLAWRNINEHKLRMFLTALGVILGTSLTLAVMILNQSMLKTFQEIFLLSGGKTDIIVSKNAPFNTQDMDYFSSMSDIKFVAPMAYINVKASTAEGRNIDVGIKGVDIYKDKQIRDYLFTDGGWFSSESKREVVIDKKSALKLGVTLNDKIRIITNSGNKDYRVVGLIEQKGAGLPGWIPEMYAPLEAICLDTGLPGAFSRVDIQLKDQSMILPVADKIKEHFGDAIETQTLTDRLDNADRAMGSLNLGLTIVVVVVIFVGCFLIYNTFMVIVLERIRLIGLLKTLGMDKSQTIRMILVEGFILGVAGTIIGTGLGYFVGEGLLAITGKSIGVEINEAIVHPFNFVLVILIGLIMPILSCLIPAVKAGSYMPIEALKITDVVKASRDKKQKFILVHKFKIGISLITVSVFYFEVLSKAVSNNIARTIIVPIGIIVLLLGVILVTPVMLEQMVNAFHWIFEGKTFLALRNLMRNKNRTSITLSIIIIGIIMSIGFSGLFNSIRESSADQMTRTLKVDITVQSKNGSYLDNFDKIFKMMKATDGVEDIYYNRQESFRDENKTWNSIIGIKADEHSRLGYFNLIQGNLDEIYSRMESGERVAVVGQYYLRNEGKGIGDIINLKGKDRDYQFTIVGIVNSPNFSGRVNYIDRDILDKMYGGKAVNLIGIKASKGFDIDLLKEKLQRDIIRNDNVNVATTSELRELVKGQVMNGTEAFDIINVITLIIALFGLMNTLLMSIFERKREIGVLRSVGYSKGQVSKMIFSESMIMGIYSTVIGVLGGILFAREANNVMGDMMNMNIKLYIPVGYVVLGVVSILACTALAAVYPSHMAVKSGIIEAVKGE